MAWSCRSHSPPWSQIGQSSGWLISRNSITPSRAFFTIAVLVLTSGGSPFGPGRQSRTPQAHDATGLGEPLSSTRHMRQLPAIDSRSWKQKRGISAPAASHACSSVYSGGTSISLPSTMSLLMPSSRCGGVASRAARRSPQFCRCHVLPAERMLARPVRLEMLEPPDRLGDARPAASRHVPEDEIGAVELLEPFGLAGVEARVHGLPHELLQRLHALPDRQVDRHARIALERTGVGRVAGRIRVAPHEAG